MINFGFEVCLCPLDSDSMEQIRSWRNTPEIMRWCRQTDLISDCQQSRWFEAQDKDPAIKMYAIKTEGADKLVGVAGFTSIDPTVRRAEFSLYVGPDSQKGGIGTKALKTLFCHGFYDLNLNLIWGESLDGNPAIKVFKELGMRSDGTRQDFYFKEGKLWDAHLFSLTLKQWRKLEWHNLLKESSLA
jgi:RimJ/RimL family protein N-acetyltransferase